MAAPGSSFPDLMDLAMPAATWQAGLGLVAQLAISASVTGSGGAVAVMTLCSLSWSSLSWPGA
jgi:hypothetical protein